jgi:hypothetical protein
MDAQLRSFTTLSVWLMQWRIQAPMAAEYMDGSIDTKICF